MSALCTEFAVFRASSTFAIDDGADVESVPAEFLPDLIGCSRHLFHRLLKELQSFLAADLSSG